MKKRLIFLLPLLLCMLACRTLFPDKATPITPTPPSVATSALEATAFAPADGFTLTRISPKNGTLQNQLATEVKKAKALGQTPFVEFDATWCPPCQAITSSLADKNTLMLDAYQGVLSHPCRCGRMGSADCHSRVQCREHPRFLCAEFSGTGQRRDSQRRRLE